MSGNSKLKIINRIIDANLNRSKEGLRVCEEITRFILNCRSLTFGFKKIRHKIDILSKHLPANLALLKERQSLKDVGRKIYVHELKRRNCKDIFLANIQRVKESLRVLEEFSKLKNINTARQFKKLRYDTYELEKKTARKLISSLRNRR